MSIKDKIIKEYDEGKAVEKLANEYSDMSCMAEEFYEDFPDKCNENGDYCEECWLNKIKEIIEG